MERQKIYFYSKSTMWFEFSNFYNSAFEVDGVKYYTVEQYFQSMKCVNPRDRDIIRLCSDPITAKKIGRKVALRADWEQVKDEIMYIALRAKFTQNITLKRMLLSTGDAILCEKSPSDYYWGYLGKNRLGELLMRLRDELYQKG